jgi:hypothetical protein
MVIEIFTMSAEDFAKVESDLIINPVNSMGVADSKIERAFKNAYPANYIEYQYSSETGRIMKGISQFTSIEGRWICNLPIKRHWLGDPDTAMFSRNMPVLRAWVEMSNISTVAIPVFNEDMVDIVKDHLSSLKDISIGVYKIC